MQQPGLRASSHLNPRSKTGSNTSLGTIAPRASAHQSRESSRQRNEDVQSVGGAGLVGEPAKSTEALIRRVLCPPSQSSLPGTQPLHELLPPLTSSNEVDLQLYAIIAIVMRDFVYSWYGKITPDHSFVEEVISIIAHCTRDLEQRFRRLEHDTLVLDEIPALVGDHISAFRTAQSVQGATNSTSPKVIYHTLFPHPALSPAPVNDLPTVEQLRNEAAYRQLLVQGVLAVLLPTEDLRNPCLRTLVADVMADMILGTGVAGKASEGWLLYDGIAKLIKSGKTKVEMKTSGSGSKVEVGTRSRLEKFGLVSSKQRKQKGSELENGRSSTISETLWRVIQYCYMTFMTIRFVLLGVLAASSAPCRAQAAVQKTAETYHVTSPIVAGVEAPSAAGKRPVLSFSIFALVSQVLELPCRMPWTYGLISLGQWHLVSGVLGIGAANGILNIFLVQTLTKQVFRPDLLPTILQNIRGTIFPNNALGPGRPVPSAAEQRLIKRRAACAILDLIPASVATRFFATTDLARKSPGAGPSPNARDSKNSGSEKAPSGASNDDPVSPKSTSAPPPFHGTEGEDSSPATIIPDPDPIREIQLIDIESILDIFGDKYMNKHLLYSIVELIFVRLVPEMRERSVQELVEERIGGVNGIGLGLGEGHGFGRAGK